MDLEAAEVEQDEAELFITVEQLVLLQVQISMEEVAEEENREDLLG